MFVLLCLYVSCLLLIPSDTKTCNKELCAFLLVSYLEMKNVTGLMEFLRMAIKR